MTTLSRRSISTALLTCILSRTALGDTPENGASKSLPSLDDAIGPSSSATGPNSFSHQSTPSFLDRGERSLSLAKFCSQLSPLVKVPMKSNFESRDEYVARLTNAAKSLGLPIGPEHAYKISFSARCLEMRYDADAEKISVGGAARPGEGGVSLESMIGYPEPHGNRVLMDFDFPNRFSKLFIVGDAPTRGFGAGLTYLKYSLARSGAEQFNMTRSIAKTKFNSMQVLAEGPIDCPAVSKGFIAVNIPYRDEVDIKLELRVIHMLIRTFTFFDPLTGEVFHKIAFS